MIDYNDDDVNSEEYDDEDGEYDDYDIEDHLPEEQVKKSSGPLAIIIAIILLLGLIGGGAFFFLTKGKTTQEEAVADTFNENVVEATENQAVNDMFEEPIETEQQAETTEQQGEVETPQTENKTVTEEAPVKNNAANNEMFETPAPAPAPEPSENVSMPELTESDLITFRKVLLEKLTLRLGSSFRRMKNDIYKNHADGFYVRAKPNRCTPSITIKYISRYLGRPVIASSRIDNYDGENVTFHYTRHEDNKTVSECIPVMEFISRLIRHIPEKQFKMLRYYGIYARQHKQSPKLFRCMSSEKKAFLRRHMDWCNSILLSFGYDPLCCPKCNTSMVVLEVYYKKTALFERYRKVMGYG